MLVEKKDRNTYVIHHKSAYGVGRDRYLLNDAQTNVVDNLNNEESKELYIKLFGKCINIYIKSKFAETEQKNPKVKPHYIYRGEAESKLFDALKQIKVAAQNIDDYVQPRIGNIYVPCDVPFNYDRGFWGWHVIKVGFSNNEVIAYE
jgi:hypothetical protein